MRLIVTGRIAASLFLLVLHVDSLAQDRGNALALGLGAGLFIAWTGVWVALSLRNRTTEISSMLGATAFVDGLSLAILAGSLSGYGTMLFGWYMVDATMFSVLLRRRRSYLLGGVLAASYATGMLVSGALNTPTDYLFLVLNAGAIVGVGVAVYLVFHEEEEQRLEIEAQAGDVAELNRRLERSVAELRAITEITELIHSTLDVETVGPALLNILETVISVPAGSLYVIDKSKQETIFTTSSAGSGSTPRTYSGLELAGAVRPAGSEGALSCIELVDYNQMIVVFCADGGAMERLTDDDRIVLTAVASELVVAVENSRLYRLTKRLAITDELTDLFNYRYLQQRIDDELGRAERYNKRLSLIMLDLDDFKRVNDTHGHLVGDSVLSEVGQLLKTTVREVDVVARYGGEEFTVILPETDASGAFIVAEKIREAISLHRFLDSAGSRSVHITASIGLSSYPVHAQDKESLLRAADDAVYHAKATGKDRVRAPRLKLRRVPSDGTEETAE
jgi:diguanylate cyclase (GGDEF)-like protein